MAVNIEAYLALESSLATRLLKSWRKLSKDALDDIIGALNAGDFSMALSMARSINVTPIFEENKDYIKFLALAALTFGATRVTDNPKDTTFIKNDHSILLEEMLDAFRYTIETSVTQFISVNLEELVRQSVQPDSDQTTILEKLERLATTDYIDSLTAESVFPVALPPKWSQIFKYSPDQPRAPKGDPKGGQWVNSKLTSEEQKLIERWAVDGAWDDYQHAARYVLSGRPKEEYVCYDCKGNDSERYDAAKKILDRIESQPVLKENLYRGISSGGVYRVGDTFSESLTSWTKKESLAKDFHDNKFRSSVLPADNGAVLVLDTMVSVGAKAIEISSSLPANALPILKEAQEYLASGEYTVTGIKDDGGQRKIFVKRVGPAKAGNVVKYDPSQPRAPKGSPIGGRWVDAGDDLDRRLVDYKPDRSLSDPEKIVPIADLLPNARFSTYSTTPFFDLVNKLQGTPDPAKTPVADYVKARDAFFDSLPVQSVELDKVVATQKFVNRDRVKEIVDFPETGGSKPLQAVRYGGETYILNGHHRVAAEVLRGKHWLTARLLVLDRIKKKEWNEEEHPRWPAGTAGSRGGEFAPKGQGTLEGFSVQDYADQLSDNFQLLLDTNEQDMPGRNDKLRELLRQRAIATGVIGVDDFRNGDEPLEPEFANDSPYYDDIPDDLKAAAEEYVFVSRRDAAYAKYGGGVPFSEYIRRQYKESPHDLADEDPEGAEALDAYIGPDYKDISAYYRGFTDPEEHPNYESLVDSYTESLAYGIFDEYRERNKDLVDKYTEEYMRERAYLMKEVEENKNLSSEEKELKLTRIRDDARYDAESKAEDEWRDQAKEEARERAQVIVRDEIRNAIDYGHERAQLIEKLLDNRKPVPDSMLVYRGKNTVDYMGWGELDPGDTIKLQGFTSNSTDLSTARAFGTKILRIVVPRGAKDVLLTSNDGEGEVMFNHNVVLHVLYQGERTLIAALNPKGSDAYEKKARERRRTFVFFGKFSEDPVLVERTTPLSVKKYVRILEPPVSFKEKANSAAENMIQLVSALHTSRLSGYGFTAEAHVRGVTEYAVNEQLDNRICPICEIMHGKTFKVSDARKALDIIIHTKDPDVLRTLQAWPKQDKESVAAFKKLSKADLIKNNWHVPPYHPMCRGLLVTVGSVPNIKDKPKRIEGQPAPSPEEQLATSLLTGYLLGRFLTPKGKPRKRTASFGSELSVASPVTSASSVAAVQAWIATLLALPQDDPEVARALQDARLLLSQVALAHT